ncbi:hypothetical protein GBN23_06595 [Plesiomonas shigelloides]|uniref:PAAR domain-containing protein n=1 Tax=Plesiomonas shigelloides TaxID=703 RepID=UPI001261E06E|nr:anthrax toxin-like adenylyl cyclase domain-containing protein [Plesiomonas shigelloides]KAB7680135.1 hypothetical protein GBN23_06595 [Plesiomonas shigelloides]
MYKVCIGTKTSTGGEVIEGNNTIIMDGVSVSSIGHRATCKSGNPGCRGAGKIVANGARSVIVNYRPVAIKDDYVDCGCPQGANIVLGEGTIHIGKGDSDMFDKVVTGASYEVAYITESVKKPNANENKEINNMFSFAAGCDFDPNSLLYSDAFQYCADLYNVIIGLRYPSEIGQLHLKEGAPSKNFHVKAKSSVSGPTAGFIPEKALYSKKMDGHKRYIMHALERGAKLVNLYLSPTQVNALLNSKLLYRSFIEDRYWAEYHGQKEFFRIDDKGAVYDINNEHVKVLTNPPEIETRRNVCVITEKAITADYDLFDFILHKNQIDRRPLSVPPRYINNRAKEALSYFSGNITKPQRLHGDESRDKGNVSFFEEVVIDTLNKMISNAGYRGGVLVWHNDEAHNPFSPGFNPGDKPVFFIPQNKPRQVFSFEQLNALYQEFKSQGYQAKLSDRF